MHRSDLNSRNCSTQSGRSSERWVIDDIIDAHWDTWKNEYDSWLDLFVDYKDIAMGDRRDETELRPNWASAIPVPNELRPAHLQEFQIPSEEEFMSMLLGVSKS